MTGMESLGQILQRQTQLTAEQLDQALRCQQTRRPRVSLGRLLIEQGLCRETEVCRALASQWNIRYAPTLTPERLRNEWIARIPLDYLKAQGMLPIADEQGRPQIALSDPLQVESYDAIATILGRRCPRVLCPAGEIEKAISRCYYQGLDADGPVSADDVRAEALSDPADDAILPAARQEDLLNIANQAPIVKLVNTILFQAVSRRASDIHIEPYDDEVKIRYRIDGVLCDVPGPPKRQLAALISRLKIMSNLNIAERRLPQDGQCRVKIGPKEFDVRVSIIPTSGGERMVLRLLDRDGSIWTVDRLGFEPRVRRHFERTIRAPHGIFLLTGPTGSGKTTTLYCAVNLLHNHERNILTVEDPIEYQLPGIGQTQVNPKIDLTFANCLRHILRQDPDVIMIGEIRDRETAEIAVHAS
ncbi:MAG: Flp pilus assembly complex ATPase component TadA, partial [Sedimentisphaerales bacterium]|nr:Flp pilus assembly complex ATPase component TadA [Sedimentisphaerales bacterium]